MQKVRIIRPKNLSKKARKLIFDGTMESARVWNYCSSTHKKARESREKWPTKDSFQKQTKGNLYSLHSQTVQMVVAQFLANVDTACQIKKENRKIRLPYKEKRFYPLMWPKQAGKHPERAYFTSYGKRKSLFDHSNEYRWSKSRSLHTCLEEWL